MFKAVHLEDQTVAIKLLLQQILGKAEMVLFEDANFSLRAVIIKVL